MGGIVLVNDELLKKALVKYDDISNLKRWDLANQILYDMCENYPRHTDANEVVAKLWLIGRSYAAAIERRKNAANFSGDFYYDVVAPAIISVSDELDTMIVDINSRASKENDENQMDCVLKCHGFLTTKFNELTELDKRSLASKYLHFHCREKVYIYDSVASSVMRKLVTKDRKKITEICNNHPEYDMEYVDFYVRALELQKYLEDNYCRRMTTREIDTLLLTYPS